MNTSEHNSIFENYLIAEANVKLAEKILMENNKQPEKTENEPIEIEVNNNYKIIETQQKNDRITFEKLQLEANEKTDLNERITFWSEKKKLFLQNRSMQTFEASGFMQQTTGLTNERFFLDMIIENEIEHLKLCLELETNNIRNSNEPPEPIILIEGKKTQQIMLLFELGIFDFLIKTNPELTVNGTVNYNKLAQTISAFTGLNAETIRQTYNIFIGNKKHTTDPFDVENNKVWLLNTLSELGIKKNK